MPRRLALLLVGVVLVLTACGTASDPGANDPSPASTSASATEEPTEEISEVDQARADAACAGYPAATKRANHVTKEAEAGKVYVFLLTAGYNDSADAIDGLNAPDGTEVGDAIADARDTIDALARGVQQQGDARYRVRAGGIPSSG